MFIFDSLQRNFIMFSTTDNKNQMKSKWNGFHEMAEWKKAKKNCGDAVVAAYQWEKVTAVTSPL